MKDSIRKTIKRDIIGKALLDGDGQTTALIKAGYSQKTAEGNGKKVLKSIDIDSYFKDWKARNAKGLLVSLTKNNFSDIALDECWSAIQKVKRNEDRARLLLEFSRLTTGRAQDLLDRVGISKDNKLMQTREIPSLIINVLGSNTSTTIGGGDTPVKETKTESY